MSEADTKQLNIIYSYIKKKKKTFSLLIKCRVCKNSFNKSEFYTTTKVCKSCWFGYVGLSKKEKKELKNETIALR